MPRKRYRSGGRIGTVAQLGSGPYRQPFLPVNPVRVRQPLPQHYCSECFQRRSQYGRWFCARCTTELFAPELLALGTLAGDNALERFLRTERRRLKRSQVKINIEI